MEDIAMGIVSIAVLWFFMHHAETKRRYGENPSGAKYKKGKS
ncbi:hypothetical protein [Sulfuricurvum sp.]|nr:hypothetical protein [Sulfuricurvum sp.]MDD2267490.1 hypothetical protein [Sulfuricurvum sp.]MDD2783962.1 hypothetical protein [Sulfuricurvum sp.]